MAPGAVTGLAVLAAQDALTALTEARRWLHVAGQDEATTVAGLMRRVAVRAEDLRRRAEPPTNRKAAPCPPTR